LQFNITHHIRKAWLHNFIQ